MTTPRDGSTVAASPFPLLPPRNGVLFPGTVITLPIGRERSVALVKELRKGDVIGVATQKEPSTTNPGEADLYRTGTFARVVDLARLPSGDYRVALEATVRFHLDKLVQHDPYWVAEGR